LPDLSRISFQTMAPVSRRHFYVLSAATGLVIAEICIQKVGLII
jgi:hypothetical protein